MEILSPASNMEHIDVAIDYKANAVYGGLKKWNARNKAINFDNKEYNLLIEKLHKHGIKFFLTLNILMLDYEIEEVITFLKNNKLPDSFIVTDIGLIHRLHKEFPSVPLHFSTQFGIHNESDIKFAESINADRAILARELTLNEISNIKKFSNIEIENFVWGSQCISYSGLCFFSSLINCGNSNRGKCIIACRDMYKVNTNEGSLLYIPDLNCTKFIEQLDKENIECIKLEGRRRKPEEIATILQQIHTKNYDNKQNGYLYGEELNQNNLYEKINKRIKPIYSVNNLRNISEFDVFMQYKNGVPVKIEKALDKEDVFYVYSEYKKSFIINKNNISLDLTIEGKEIVKVLYINSNGEGHTFISNASDRKVNIEIANILSDIGNITDLINLYKIKYVRNIEDDYYISSKMYSEILKYICEDNLIKDIQNEKNKKLKINNIFVEVDNEKYIESIIDDSFVKVIYNIATIEKMQNIKEITDKYQNKIIYKLPIFNFKSIELNKYYEILQNKEVMFTRPSQIYETKNIKFKKKYIDYTIYIWNKSALDYFKEYDITVFTASPELSFQKNIDILKNNEIQFIIGGKIPLAYTRQCFSHIYNCKNCNLSRKQDKSIYNLDKEMDLKIHCYSDYRIIVNNNPILNNFQRFNMPNNATFRYITNNQDINEILQSIEMFKKTDYFNIMKDHIIWKNSYEGNMIESRY